MSPPPPEPAAPEVSSEPHAPPLPPAGLAPRAAGLSELPARTPLIVALGEAAARATQQASAALHSVEKASASQRAELERGRSAMAAERTELHAECAALRDQLRRAHEADGAGVDACDAATAVAQGTAEAAAAQLAALQRQTAAELQMSHGLEAEATARARRAEAEARCFAEEAVAEAARAAASEAQVHAAIVAASEVQAAMRTAADARAEAAAVAGGRHGVVPSYFIAPAAAARAPRQVAWTDEAVSATHATRGEPSSEAGSEASSESGGEPDGESEGPRELQREQQRELQRLSAAFTTSAAVEGASAARVDDAVNVLVLGGELRACEAGQHAGSLLRLGAEEAYSAEAAAAVVAAAEAVVEAAVEAMAEEVAIEAVLSSAAVAAAAAETAADAEGPLLSPLPVPFLRLTPAEHHLASPRTTSPVEHDPAHRLAWQPPPQKQQQLQQPRPPLASTSPVVATSAALAPAVEWPSLDSQPARVAPLIPSTTPRTAPLAAAAPFTGAPSSMELPSPRRIFASASSALHLSPHASSSDAADVADAADAAVSAAAEVLLPFTAARMATVSFRDVDTSEHGAPMSVPRSTLLDAWRWSSRQPLEPHAATPIAPEGLGPRWNSLMGECVVLGSGMHRVERELTRMSMGAAP